VDDLVSKLPERGELLDPRHTYPVVAQRISGSSGYWTVRPYSNSSATVNLSSALVDFGSWLKSSSGCSSGYTRLDHNFRAVRRHADCHRMLARRHQLCECHVVGAAAQDGRAEGLHVLGDFAGVRMHLGTVSTRTGMWTTRARRLTTSASSTAVRVRDRVRDAGRPAQAARPKIAEECATNPVNLSAVYDGERPVRSEALRHEAVDARGSAPSLTARSPSTAEPRKGLRASQALAGDGRTA
jgi:hypothetical protein